MKPKIKITILIFGFALTSMFLGPKRVAAAGCDSETLRFFPKAKVSAVIGPITSDLNTSTAGSSLKSCNYSLQTPPGGLFTAHILKASSAQQALSVFKTSNFGTSLGIGDASSFKSGGDAAVLKDQYIFTIFWYCFCTQTQFLSETQAKDLLGYAISQLTAADLPKPPTVSSVSPGTVPAGVYEGLAYQIGIALYKDAEIKNFSITGTNLQGTQLKSPKDLYGRDAFRFAQIQVSPDGTSISATMYVSTGAVAGANKITVTNSANLSATATVDVTITGTQDLKRKFPNIQFRGNWPDIAPNPELTEIENGIQMGLTSVNRPNYKSLRIQYYIFSKDYWLSKAENQYCHTNGVRMGCAAPWNSTVYISTGFGHLRAAGGNPTTQELINSDTTDKRTIGETILHESAHKLEAAILGIYFGNPFQLPNAYLFTRSWKAAVGDLSKCTYLPLNSQGAWSDGSRLPRCGFARPYGSSDTLIPYAEDIATLTEKYYFEPELFRMGDGPTDPRYSQKYSILKKYGFL